MLNVENISLYYGAAQALRGVSIAAEPGKVTCVLGRNGLGKTSLLRAMVGQYPIASGSITFDIVLVQQYLDLACEAGDRFAVMDRGAVKYSCGSENLERSEISRAMAL